MSLFSRKRGSAQQQQQPIRPYLNRPVDTSWNNTVPVYPSALWEKPIWEMNSSSGSLLSKPIPTYARPDTSSSMRPSVLGLQQPSRSPFPPPNPLPSPSALAERGVLYIDPRESRPQFHFSQPRRASVASSTSLPIEGPRRADSHKRTSSLSSISPLERMMDSMEERGHGRGQSRDVPIKDSRFSWTNSQAPKTPLEQSRLDTSRFSVATSTSSVPRFRSIDSWVGHQATRLDEHQFQEYLEMEIENKIQYQRPPQASTGIDVAGSSSRSAREKREPYNSGLSASFFMQHPGTEVPLPAGSRIPSAILDTKIGPREL
jgi:hypothetical protein